MPGVEPGSEVQSAQLAPCVVYLSDFAFAFTDKQVHQTLSFCFFIRTTERHVAEQSIKFRHRFVSTMAYLRAMESGTEARRFQLQLLIRQP